MIRDEKSGKTTIIFNISPYTYPYGKNLCTQKASTSSAPDDDANAETKRA